MTQLCPFLPFTLLSAAPLHMRSEEWNRFFSLLVVVFFSKEKFATLLSSAKPLESFALMNNISYGECLCDFHGVVTSPPTNFDAWRLLLFFAKVLLHTTSCKWTRVGNGSLVQGERLSRRGGGRAGRRVSILDTVLYKIRHTRTHCQTFCLALWTITEKTFWGNVCTIKWRNSKFYSQ